MKTSAKALFLRLALLSFVLTPLFARAVTTNYFNFNDTSLASGAGPSTPANGVTSISGPGLAVGDKIVFDGVVINLPGTSSDAWGAVNLNNSAAGTRGVTASQIGVLARSTTGGANGCQIFINSGSGVGFGPSAGSRTNRVRIELTATIANSTTNMNYTVQVDQSLTGTFNATATAGTLTFTNNQVALTFGSQNFSHSFQNSLILGSVYTPSSTVAVGDSAVFSVVITNGYPVLGTSQQWLSNGVPISGATGLTYATPAVTAGFSGSQYSVVVTNLLIPANVFTSSVVTLAVRSANTLTWRGVGTVNSNNWDYTATNWVTGGVRTNFVDGDTVTFDDTGTNVFVGLTNVVQPAGLTFNSASNYALFGSGGISGSTSLIKSGNGTLTLGVTNAYTGATTISGGTLQLASAAGVASAPVLYMSFDDVSGTNVINEGSGGPTLNGVLTGTGATIVSGGRHGKALSIDGNGAKAATNIVLIAGGRGVNLDASASWTVGYWVKTSTAGSMCLYQGAGNFNSGAETIFYINSASATTAGTKAGGVRYGGGFLTGTTVINDGNWHFIAMVNNLGSETIYVDGNSDVVTSSMGGSSTSAANQLWIGGGTDTDTSATKLNGLLDEVFMYNRALSQGEIQRMMNASGSLPAASAVSVAAGSKLDLSGFSQTVSGLTGGGTVDTVSSINAVVLTVSNATSGTFSGIITNTAGSLSFVKTGAGALTLSGTNAASGANTVSAGTLNISGNITAGAGTMTVGNVAGNSVVNFSGVGLTNNNYNIGTISGGVGALYQTAGTVRANQAAGGVNFQIGNAVGAYGYYYGGSGSTLSANEIGVGGEALAGNGIMDINGATVNDAGWLVVARVGGAQTGIVNVFSGLLTYAGGGEVNCWGAAGSTGIINIMGGAVTNTLASVGFNLNQSGAANTAILNLNGGVAQGNAVSGTAARVNFNGGTLQASVANASFMTGLGSANIYSGGGTINNNNFAITIAQPLLAPVGSGVNGIASFTAGTGYVAPPIVAVVRGSGDTTGVGATAIAQIDRAAGTVTNILITNPGVSYTVTPTFTLSGGGATTPATITGQAPTANSSGGMTFQGGGITSLTGTSTYTGNTTVSAGTLKIGVGGSLANSLNLIVAGNAVLDITTAGGTLVANQNILGSGAVNGALTTAATSKIYPGTDGTAGTLTFNTGLTMTSGSTFNFDVSASASSGNDKVVVTGTLALNSTVFNIKGPGTLASSDYTLATGTSITGTPTVTWIGTSPGNAGFFTIVNDGTTVKLHFNGAPTVTAGASPTTLTRNQTTAITATVTPGGGGSVASVVADLTQIGGSATANLVLSDVANVYTNTFAVGAGTAAGSKLVTITVTDVSSFTGSAVIPLTVVVSGQVWNGGGAGDSWSTNANWTSGAAPALSGDSLTFAGTTRLTPSMDTNYSVTGLIFNSTAGAFNIGSANGSALTLTGVGMTNNSANTQTLNVPVVLGAAHTFNAAAGNLTLSQNVTNGGFAIIVAGASNTVVNGSVSGSGSLTKNDAGTLTLNGANTYTGNATISSGTLNMSGSLVTGAGGITLNPANASSASLNYSGAGAFNRTGQLIAGSVGGGTGTVNVSGTASVSFGSGISYIGYLSGIGVFNMTGGTFTNAGEVQVGGSDTSGTGINGTGTLTMSGGVANFGAFTVARGNNNQNTVSGSVTVSGGTLTSVNDVILGFAGNNNLGKLTLNGGNVNVGPAATKWLMLSEYDTSKGQLDITSGSLNLMNSSAIKFTTGNTGTSSTNTINQNGGSVTYYSDAGVTVGGTGDLDLARSGAAACTNIYNLNGGTLTVPAILSLTTLPTRIFNFNGGVLKPTANNVTFLNLGTGNAVANVRNGGAKIDSNGKDITIAQALLHSSISGDAATDGGLSKNGVGRLTLTASNTYTGPTVISGGTLALTNSGSIASTPSITISNGAIFDVSAAGITLAANQNILGGGAVTGALTTVTSSKIYPGTDGTVDTLTFNSSLTMASGSMFNFDLSTSAGSGNDQVIVAGALTLNSTVFHVKAPNTSVNLDTTTDYVLISAGSISGTPAVTPVFDVSPLNASHFTLVISGNTLVLHYNINIPPTGGGNASPATLARNQSTLISVAATNNGSGTIASVTLDASSIGGSSTFPLVSDNAGNWTNTVAVSASTTVGSKTLVATITDTVPLVGTTPISLTVTTANEVWNGGGAGDSWGTNANWTSGAAPGLTGDSLTFAGTSRLTPSMDTNYSVTGLIFDGTAGAFNIGTPNGSALTLTGAGVTNNSTSSQTLNVPVVLGAAQTLNAASGPLTLGQSIVNGGNLITVTGSSNSAVNGAITGTGGLTKVGNGTLTLSGSSSFAGAVTVSAGTLLDSGTITNTTLDTIGNLAGNNAVVRIAGGHFGAGFNSGQIFGSSINLGTVATASGFVQMSSGTFDVHNQMAVGTAAYSAFSQSGGASTVAGFIALGATANGGVMNVSGGTVACFLSPITIAYSSTAANAVMNLSGTGALNVTGAAGNGVWPGEFGTGALNVFDTASITVANDGIILGKGNGTASKGLLNLLGGTTTVNSVSKGTGGGILGFNGGTLKANVNNATFLTGLNAASVYSGGATIDDGGFAITIPQTLLAPTGSGVTSIAVSAGGTGYIDTPLVTISGGSGSNATAIAQIDSTAGTVTNILITSPGNNYTNTDTLTVSLVGGGGSGATAGAVTIGANSSGGLVKAGSGTLTLTGLNTFSGDVNVNAGTLKATLANNINNPTFSALGNPQIVRNLTVNNGGTLTFGAGDTLGGATTTMASTLIINSNGIVNNVAGNFNTLGAIQLNGGTLTGVGGAISGYQMYNLRGTVTVGGASASTISGSGTFAGYHLAFPTVFNVADVTAGNDLNVSGILVDQDATHGGAGSLAKSGAGTMVLSGINTFSGSTTISNGTLALSGSGSLANSSGITVNAGALYDVSGVTSVYSLGATQTLAGNGSVNGVVTNLGTIAPGIADIGTLTFSNSPVFNGTVLAEINRNGGTPIADNVTVNGTLTYGGTLTVANIGAALTGGEVFSLFSATSYSGAFTSTNLPALGAGLNWWTGNLINNGTLVVNVSPTAGNANYTRAKGVSFKIKISDLLTNVTGAVAGKTITLTGVGAGTNGATITTGGTYIFYTPATNNDNDESFTYTVGDGRGGSATGTINLTVASAVSDSLSFSLVGGTATINGFGIPGYTYVLQTTTNLTTPWWTIFTNTAAGNGTLNFTDPNATNAQQYYRTAQP